MTRRNLITGGAGFVGSHLVDRLMEAGEEVICLENYFTGRKQNIQHWLNHPRFELIRHDVTDPIRLEVDRIWHLACPASPVHYQHNPIKTAKTSFLGTYNMLGLARRVGATGTVKAGQLLAPVAGGWRDALRQRSPHRPCDRPLSPLRGPNRNPHDNCPRPPAHRRTPRGLRRRT